MAIQTLATLKNWFKTGLKPTQGQFWDTWDSFWHKSDKIPIDSVDGLDTIINNTVTQEVIDNTVKNVTITTATSPLNWTIPAGRLLDQIVLLSDLQQDVTIETADGAADIADNDTIDADGVGTYVVNIYGHAGAKVIFKFSEEITLKLYIR